MAHNDREKELRAALEPATQGALTRIQAENLILASAAALRQGGGIGYHSIAAMLDELFGKDENARLPPPDEHPFGKDT